MKSWLKRSLKNSKLLAIRLFGSLLLIVLLCACTSPLQMLNSDRVNQASPVATSSQNDTATATQQPEFASNGERIYFTSTSDRDTDITPTGLFSSGGMLGQGTKREPLGNGTEREPMGNGTRREPMGNGTEREPMGNSLQTEIIANDVLSCATCHRSDGHGGEHTMLGMQTMDSPDIRWSALQAEFNDDEKLRLAITQGADPDSETLLNRNMPRWQIDHEDLDDLIGFLKTL
jgi:hypothetical protein